MGSEMCIRDSIGNVLWNWRMFLATGEGRFMDVVELALYNSVLSGTSLDGTNFFYVNPLRSVRPMPIDLRWKHERVPFMGSFCCPPNLARTLAEVGGFAYGKSENALWVNLYGSSEVTAGIKNAGKVRLKQETDYPWNGRIRFTVEECPVREFAVNLRVPRWVSEPGKSAKVKINGVRADRLSSRAAGYLTIRRAWKQGDTVELELSMPARLVESNPMVEETLNQVAVKRGPLIYCLEGGTTQKKAVSSVMDVSIPANAELAPRFDRSVLGGVEVIETQGFVREKAPWGRDLYRSREAVSTKRIKLQFVPYFAWANRGANEMTVWLPLTPK